MVCGDARSIGPAFRGRRRRSRRGGYRRSMTLNDGRYGQQLINAFPYNEVHTERIRADKKHNANGKSMEYRNALDPAWLPVLVEEVGEVARAICDTDLDHIQEELIQ